MRVLDLFSGVGGFSLGLESVGMTTVAFCERDGYARRVLKKHWPTSWIYEDITTLSAKRLKQDGVGPIDLICGGFPCQDISTAGKGAGIEGARSGLWSEYARLIREVKPAWVIAENVPALRSRGADRVLGDLESAGYTAWALVVGAIHAGAPHRRQRAWIVANAKSQGHDNVSHRRHAESQHGRSALADAHVQRQQSPLQWDAQQVRASAQADGREFRPQSSRSREALADTAGGAGHAMRRQGPSRNAPRHGTREQSWRVEPDVGRVAHGVPARVDRLRCLGNAVVPAVVAMIGQAVLEADRQMLSDPSSITKAS
jgi:DNA (cytosine-5)-methyltransferase 1